MYGPILPFVAARVSYPAPSPVRGRTSQRNALELPEHRASSAPLAFPRRDKTRPWAQLITHIDAGKHEEE